MMWNEMKDVIKLFTLQQIIKDIIKLLKNANELAVELGTDIDYILTIAL